MRTQPLFLDKPLTFSGVDKYAGMLTPLGDNADMWPQQITQEAYKQLPFLSDFAVNVVLDKVDEEHGYAVGSVEVQPKSAMTSMERDQRPMKIIQIPFVVRDKMLAPLDIYVDMEHKQYKPLTEGRVRSALFRADVFDAARDRPPEASLYTDLQPPMDSTGGAGGVKLGNAAGTFLASKLIPKKEELKKAAMIPLLPQLRDRVNPDHISRFNREFDDPSVKMAFQNAHEGVRAAAASAKLLTPSDTTKTAAAVWGQISPNVVQFRKLANGQFLMKTANSEMYNPQQQQVSPEQVQTLLADLGMMPQLENDGTLTASPDTAVKTTLDAEEVRAVDQPGIWLVQDKTGNTLTGWAFPQLLTLDLKPLPLTLFTNGSQYAMQESIAGRLVGKTADVPRGVMQGYGCLYYLDHGTPRVFEPMSIKSSYRAADGLTHYMASTDTGEEVAFCFAPGMKNPARVGNNEWAMPDCFKWMPLKGTTELVEQPMLFTKVAVDQSTVGEVLGEKGIYTLRGVPFQKLATHDRQFLSTDDTLFLGAAAGIEPSFMKVALKRADKGEIVKFAGLRQVSLASEKLAAARERVKEALANLPRPIRNYNLVKEASILDDAMTADKILGLGFLNAENVNTFVDLLPGLEYASSKIAEMLFASRLGLPNVKEVALERMLVALEDVIQGLKALQQKDLTFTGTNAQGGLS
jgi:hypothetical protein